MTTLIIYATVTLIALVGMGILEVIQSKAKF